MSARLRAPDETGDGAGDTPMVAETEVRTVDALLAQCHGPQQFKAPSDPLAELIRTILSQNTTAANYSAAFSSLTRRFPDWEAVADASVDQIAEAIRIGGLAQIKAPRIRRIIRQVIDEHGSPTLEWIDELSPRAATEQLLKFDGVGPKTAACVLMFALGKQVFPVDTHVRRIAERLGWVPPGLSDTRIHAILGECVPPDCRYQLHINMVTHGRRICKARNPDCDACPLVELCDWVDG